jgi:transcriptional regulator with XRE-family HTH domain
MYGSLVRKARLSRGLTQRQVAAISGVEQSNISAIEHDRRMPTVETLHRLLTACGYELTATAGRRVLAVTEPPVRADEFPTVTGDTPMAVRVRVINDVLDLAETIVRSRR